MELLFTDDNFGINLLLVFLSGRLNETVKRIFPGFDFSSQVPVLERHFQNSIDNFRV